MPDITGIFDSHAHYDDKQFNTDRDILLSSLQAKGVSHVLNASDTLKASRASAALSEKYPFMYAAVGIHPHNCAKTPPDYLFHLKELSKKSRVVAIGEIGLDYHYDFSPRELQREFFQQQMQLAEKLDLPVVIHSREATADTLSVLRNFPKVRGVMHCFGGSAQTAEEVLSLGYYIGFTGVITFANARKAVEAAAVVPTGRLFVETDCPYMAPHPHRGQRCDSSMLPYVIEKLAQIKNIPAQQLADNTRNNVFELIQISDFSTKV